MKNEKYKTWRFEIFSFLLIWYLPFCISTAGDKYFDLPSCVMINRVRIFHPQFAIPALVLVTVIYFASFAFRRFHIFICILLCIDGMSGLLWLASRINFLYGWEDIIGFRAYFWKPFFDAIGLELKEDHLFNLSRFISGLFPSLVYYFNINFLRAAYRNWMPDESKRETLRQQLREWRKHKLILALIFILLPMFSFYLIRGFYQGEIRLAERHERERQEFLYHLEAAENGNVSSMTRVGGFYWWGDGTEHNSPEAVRWLEKAAQNGSADAMSFLGRIYYAGYRTGRDWKKAKYWLTASIKTDPEHPEYHLYILDRIDKNLLPFSVNMNSLRVGHH